MSNRRERKENQFASSNLLVPLMLYECPIVSFLISNTEVSEIGELRFRLANFEI